MSTSTCTLGTLSIGAFSLMLVAPVLAGCSGNAPEEPTGTSQSAMTVCGMTSVNGMDISHYDGTIDWQMAHASGIAFAFAKATEGTGFTDPTFATNWAGMQAAGVVRGAYHFFHSNMDPMAQASFVVSTVGPLAAGDLPIALDLEVDDGQPASVVASTALAFLQAVTAMSGKTAVVYASPSFINMIGNPAGSDTYPLWIANWGVSCPDVPGPWTNWEFWQSSATGTVPGVSAGAVDLDTFNGTLSQLQGMMGGTDAGTGTDTGTGGSDAGGGTDGGVTMGDSGSSGHDSGGGGDGSPPHQDAGLLDSGPHGGGGDSGSPGNPATGGGSGSSSGCGCEVGPGAGTQAWAPGALMVMMMVGWGIRRRERRS